MQSVHKKDVLPFETEYDFFKEIIVDHLGKNEIIGGLICGWGIGLISGLAIGLRLILPLALPFTFVSGSTLGCGRAFCELAQDNCNWGDSWESGLIFGLIVGFGFTLGIVVATVILLIF